MNIKNIKSLNTEMIMHLSACIDKMEIGQELKKMEVNPACSIPRLNPPHPANKSIRVYIFLLDI